MNTPSSIYLLYVFISYAIMLRYAIVCYAWHASLVYDAHNKFLKANKRILSYLILSYLIVSASLSYSFYLLT